MKQEILNNIKRIMTEATSAYKAKQIQRANTLYRQALTQFEQVQPEEFTNDVWRLLSHCQIFFVNTSLPEEKEQSIKYTKQTIEILNRVEPKTLEDWRKIAHGHFVIGNFSNNNQEKTDIIKKAIEILNRVEPKTLEDWRKIADGYFVISNIVNDDQEKIEHAKQTIECLNKIEEKTPNDRRRISRAHFFISKLINDNQEKIEHSKLGIWHFHEGKEFFSLIKEGEKKDIIASYDNLNKLMSDEERIAYFEQMNNFYNNLIESSESKHFDPPTWRRLTWLRHCMLMYLLRDNDIERKKNCLVNLLESINKIPKEARIDDDLQKIAKNQFYLADCYSRENDVEQAKKWFINSLGSSNHIMDKNEKNYQTIHQCYQGLSNCEFGSTFNKSFYLFASTVFSASVLNFERDLNKLYTAIIALPLNHILIRGLFCLLQLLPKDNALEKFPNSAIKTCLSDPKKRAWVNGLTEEMAKMNDSLLTLSNLVEGSNHFSTLVAFSIKDLQARVKTLQGEKEELKTQNQMLKEKLSFVEERMEKMEALLTSLLPSKEEEKESEKQERSDDEPEQPKKKLRSNLFARPLENQDDAKKHAQLLKQ